MLDQGVVDIPPREIITYTKQTQTLFFSPESTSKETADEPPGKKAVDAAVGTDMATKNKKTQETRKTEDASGTESGEKNATEDDEKGDKESKPRERLPITILSEEEANSAGNSAEFTSFLTQTTRVVDRVISIDERYPDVTTNYVERAQRHRGRRHARSNDDDADADGADGADAEDEGTGHLTVEEELREARVSGSGRTVTCLDWSPVHQELVLAALSAPAAATDELGGAGAVLVWSVPSTLGGAEYALTCQSEVMAAMFSPASPQCVLGGTRAGQIVLWDIRAGRAPVVMRPPSRRTHSWPVYALSMTEPFAGQQRASSASSMLSSYFGQGGATTDNIGTAATAAGAGATGTATGAAAGATAGTLASLSSDGRLCLWSLRNLAQPLECYDMPVQPRTTEALALGVPAYSSSTFVVGCVDGSVMTYTAHGRQLGTGERASAHDGHRGAVVAAAFHPPSPHPVYDAVSRVFLTASTDWTVKLWAASRPQTPAHVLRTFPRFADAVFDVKWAPAAPAVFAAADGAGCVSLWDITAPTAGPCASVRLPAPATSLRWNTHGSRLAAGTAAGTVSVLGVSDKSCSARVDDYAAVDSTLSRLLSPENQAAPVHS